MGYHLLKILLSTLALLMWSGLSYGEIFCVNTTEELNATLLTASSNADDDVIRIMQGLYYGNFIYSTGETFSLEIEGGYIENCATRVDDSTNTILDGDHQNVTLAITSSEIANFFVSGLTIQNGQRGDGGGMYIETKGSVNLINNIVSNNTSEVSVDGHGGGIYINSNSAVINNNTFIGNESKFGGGFYLKNGDVELTGNNFIRNNASYAGGGAYFSEWTTANLTDNYVSENNSRYGGGSYFFAESLATLNGNSYFGNTADFGGGGGAYFYRNHPNSTNTSTLTNNTFISNSTSGGGGGAYFANMHSATLTNNTFSQNTAIYGGGGIYTKLNYDNASFYLYNNIIWNNSAPQASDLYIDNETANFIRPIIEIYNNNFDQTIDGFYLKVPISISPSNLNNLDPVYVYISNGNFRLQTGSPLLNSGNNDAPELTSSDKDGLQRIQDEIVDIGAFEGGFAPPLISDITVSDSIAPGTDMQLPFGTTTEGNSVSQTVTVTNDGNTDLVFGLIADANILEEPFTITADTCSEQTLAPASSCSVTVSFAPKNEGTFSDAFDIPSSDPDEPSVAIAVSGTGLSSIVNNPPSIPKLISPANGQSGLNTALTFKWEPSQDPDGDTLTYMLYCSADKDFENVNSIVLASLVDQGVLIAGFGLGGVLLLVTVPPCGFRKRRLSLFLICTLLALSLSLTACGGGGNPPDNSVSANVSELSAGTTYYWKVVVDDGNGEQVESAIRSFTTK